MPAFNSIWSQFCDCSKKQGEAGKDRFTYYPCDGYAERIEDHFNLYCSSAFGTPFAELYPKYALVRYVSSDFTEYQFGRDRVEGRCRTTLSYMFGMEVHRANGRFTLRYTKHRRPERVDTLGWVRLDNEFNISVDPASLKEWRIDRRRARKELLPKLRHAWEPWQVKQKLLESQDRIYQHDMPYLDWTDAVLKLMRGETDINVWPRHFPKTWEAFERRLFNDLKMMIHLGYASLQPS